MQTNKASCNKQFC